MIINFSVASVDSVNFVIPATVNFVFPTPLDTDFLKINNWSINFLLSFLYTDNPLSEALNPQKYVKNP